MCLSEALAPYKLHWLKACSPRCLRKSMHQQPLLFFLFRRRQWRPGSGLFLHPRNSIFGAPILAKFKQPSTPPEDTLAAHAVILVYDDKHSGQCSEDGGERRACHDHEHDDHLQLSRLLDGCATEQCASHHAGDSDDTQHAEEVRWSARESAGVLDGEVARSPHAIDGRRQCKLQSLNYDRPTSFHSRCAKSKVYFCFVSVFPALR